MQSNENNYAEVIGTISTEPTVDHVLYGEGFYKAVIDVKRMSGTIDRIPLTIPQRLISEENVTLAIGEKYNVSGQLRSYNKCTDDGRKLAITLFARGLYRVSAQSEDINDIYLCGFLCKKANFRTTPFSREIADMLLAVNRAYNKSDYLPCIAWGRNAHFASSLDIGARVSLYGRLQSREYQKLTADGESVTKTAYEVSCTSVEVM